MRRVLLLLFCLGAAACQPNSDAESPGSTAGEPMLPAAVETWLDRAEAWRRAGWLPAAAYAEAQAALALHPAREALRGEAVAAEADLRRHLMLSVVPTAPVGLVREAPVGVGVSVDTPLRERLEVRLSRSVLQPPRAPRRSTALSLDEGRTTVELEIRCDLPGLEEVLASIPLSIEVDRTKPDLHLAGVDEDGAGSLLIRSDAPRVLCGHTEALAQVSAWDARGDAFRGQADAAGTFEIPASLLSGAQVFVETRDPAGNTHRRRVALRHDRRSPTFSEVWISHRTDGWTVRAQATDDVGIAAVEALAGSGARVRPLSAGHDATWRIEGTGPPPMALRVRDRVGRVTEARLPPRAVWEQAGSELRVIVASPVPGLTARIGNGASRGFVTGVEGRAQALLRLPARGAPDHLELSLRDGGTIARARQPITIDRTAPRLIEIQPPPGGLPNRWVALRGKADEEIRCVRWTHGDDSGEEVVSGRTFELPAFRLSRSPSTVHLQIEDVHGNRREAEVAYEHDPWIDAREQAVRIHLDRTEALTFASSRRRAWLRLEIGEAGTYAFEALARRAGQALSLRIRVRDETRPDRVLAERAGIRGRTFRGDPQAVALLAPGSYLVEVERRSGRGTAAFLVKRTQVRRGHR